MALALLTRLRKLFITACEPNLSLKTFLSRQQTQESPGHCQVSVAVPDIEESQQLFGVHLARRKIQPVHLRLKNTSIHPLRLHLLSIDPEYFTPLEAASLNTFLIA